MFLMLNLLPLWAFKDAIRGREQLVEAFSRYHREGSYKEGSEYIQRWTDHFIKEAIPEPDVARFHIGSMFALVANTIPAAFWMVYRVFSDPAALRECREEASKSVRERDGVCTVDVRYIKHSCPVLLSTFQEVFRVHGMANSVRVADSDQLLDNKYLIKKGGMIMMPARVQHRMREVWGETVDEFDHHRFVKSSGVKRPNPVAFRGFGGGTTLCPGRHFATTEILVLAAMLLLRFDLVPAEGSWVKPTTENSSQAEAIEQPDHDMDVEFRPRAGANKTWRVSFEDNMEAALVAEDL
jgi:cytochrome P450